MTRSAGYHGKIPTQGDFIQRGLPPGFTRAWDRWLSAHCNALAWTGRALLPRSWYDGAVLWIRTHTDL